MMRAGFAYMYRGLLLSGVLIAVAGCGDEPPSNTQQQTSTETPAAPAPPPATASQETTRAVTADTEPQVVVQRFRPERDPFRSVFAERAGRAANDTQGHPLEQYSVQQLELLGIIWGIPEPRALVRTPGGDEYTIEVGTPVGTGGGRVVSVLQDRVVVVERYYDYRGQLQSERYELKLPQEEE